MNPKQKKIWFRAKTYGWGWGLPCSWEGWVVFGAWLGIVIGAGCLFPLDPKGFHAVVGGATIVLLIICLIKGERPKWRWGKD